MHMGIAPWAFQDVGPSGRPVAGEPFMHPLGTGYNMRNRTTLLLLACLLMLPSCKHTVGGPGASDPNAPVEFRYGPGTRNLHGEGTLVMMRDGKSIGKGMSILSNDLQYVVKKKGNRLVWHVTALTWEEFGQPKATGPYYDITFTSDAKGRDKSDLKIHAVRNEDARQCIATTMAEIGLADGSFKPGEAAIPVPVEALKASGIEMRFEAPDPRYVYDGIKMVDGEECYAFSFSSDSMTIIQQGKETKGSMTVSTVMSKNMLPVHEEVVLIIDGPIKGMSSKLTAVNTRTKAPAGNKTEALRTKLQAAPVIAVNDPIEFKYTPSRGRYAADVQIKLSDGLGKILYLPFRSYDLEVRIEAAGERLAWSLFLDNYKLLGTALKDATSRYAYSSDEHGGDMADFTAAGGTAILKEADIRTDFLLPAGTYRTGDVVMPVDLGKQTLNNVFFFPLGSGYVLKGIQTIDSMNVLVLEADIPEFSSQHRKTGEEATGSLKVIRRYDLATMLPLWFEGRIELITDDKTPTVVEFEFHRMLD
ncbi:MAG: hypothetical protein V3571_04005 [Pseudodesulfovibrio sp.]